MMPVGVVWYGERGVINSLVLALDTAEAVKELLHAVQRANAGDGAGRDEPEWIERVQDVKFLVEIAASQFGNPDLIIICKTDDARPYVVFLEAKVAGYLDNAMSIRGGIRENFNSSINGQLSLKYRLSRALSCWNGPPATLSEPEDVADAYRQAPGDGGLGDPQLSPRRLAKSNVLQILYQNDLVGLSLDRFHYVALTRDVQPFFSRDFSESELRPLFLDGAGTETWNTPQTRARVGWLGYGTIAANLARYLGAEYNDAVATMMPAPVPQGLVQAQPQEFHAIRTYRIEKKSKRETKETLDAIEAVAKKRFGAMQVKREIGSTSIRPFDKVLVKLVPRYRGQDEYLLLGLAASLGRQDWDEHHLDTLYRIGVGPSAQDFYLMKLPPQTDKAVEIADDIFEMLAEMLELDQENTEV
jgi:hypothetical protein